MDTFVKNTTGRAADWEAAGLEWLARAEPDGGVRICRVLGRPDGGLELERIREAAPSKSAAGAFGQALAVTHDAGAPAFGAGPDGWEGDGYQGPAGQQLDLRLGSWESWGEFCDAARVAPLVRAGRFGADERALFGKLCDRLRAGDFDDDDAPARCHGDLWSGNVLWSEDEVVLIDPTAFGGHRESDLAALSLFGAPHLREIIAGYQQVHPLQEGWEDRVALHQIHLMLLHAVLFGGGYVTRALEIARRYA
ncbi:MAG: fructosamine kinase family protein [Actinomycetia bacterium]|nr:fructosamine kinase family protein [Actinomycetes bacterium]